MWRQFGTLLLAAAVVAGACTTQPAEGYERLTDIENVEELAEVFDAGKGSPRLILLLSPT